MAQINITLNQDEVLRLLSEDSGEAFKLLLQETLNAVLRAESSEQLCAEPYERTAARCDSRNGSRERPLTTRIGTIELAVPRHRNVPFKTLVFDNYQRSEAALVTTMAEMVVGGVSTAKVGKVMETLCGKSFSKQTVSEACKELDASVKGFSDRKIDGNYLFVMVDATGLKVRERHRIESKSLMVAMGFTPEGKKEIIGFNVYDIEDTANWTDFLKGLLKRGLSGMEMFTSDAHPGLIAGLMSVYPGVAWQRCQAHFTRDIVDGAPKRYKAGLRSELADMFNRPTIEAARARRDEIIADYAEVAPKASECLDRGFDDAMTVMELPAQMRRCVRTSNYLERLNREIKRRSKVIGIFPNVASATRLIGSFLIEENERWASANVVYYKPAVKELDERKEALSKIASSQNRLHMAA